MDLVYKLKSLYSLEDAADRIAANFSQPITIQNLLEFASNGHIQLHWNLDHHPAIKAFKNEQDQRIEFLDGPLLFPISANDDLPKYCRTMAKLSSVTDLWWLCEYEDVPFDNMSVCDSDGQLWSLQSPVQKDSYANFGITEKEPFNSLKRYTGRYEWPKLTELVFTKEELERFESSFSSTPKTEFGNRERQTLLKLIIGMAKDGYGYDPSSSRSPFPKELEGILDKLGIPVSDDTVRKWLKEAAEILPTDIDGLDD